MEAAPGVNWAELASQAEVAAGSGVSMVLMGKPGETVAMLLALGSTVHRGACVFPHSGRLAMHVASGNTTCSEAADSAPGRALGPSTPPSRPNRSLRFSLERARRCVDRPDICLLFF